MALTVSRKLEQGVKFRVSPFTLRLGLFLGLSSVEVFRLPELIFQVQKRVSI